MKDNDHTYFANIDCCHYPCHEHADAECFNCLFCYCPLYSLGEKCGGNFVFTSWGTKDCSNCLLPHSKNGFDYIVAKIAACDICNADREEET